MINPQMQSLLTLLQQSPWLSAETIVAKQNAHLDRIIQHAKKTVPLFQTLYADFDLDSKPTFSDLPILSREYLQEAGDKHISLNIPPQHGRHYSKSTSGSTGKPVNILLTDYTRLIYDALMLREHDWHNRHFSKTLMAIKWNKKDFAPAPIGIHQSTWGPPINQYKKTGSSIFINVISDTRSQIEAILFYKPHYLFSYASQMAALAEHCITNDISMPFIEEIRLTGETLQDHYHDIMKRAWPHVKITDLYSSEEVGFIAQQCPEFHQYHVTSENVYVEIVDANQKPCAIGQPGNVIVTSLWNYATPLIRYDIGDCAVWGEPCPCGRNLPVLKKLLGRKRNRLFLPNGESLFPYLGEREDSTNIISNIRKFQFIQHSVHDIEIKLVLDEPLTTEQERKYIKLRQTQLGYPFNIKLTYQDDLHYPNGKFEEFISYV